MTDLYLRILDFVILAKKLEFAVRRKFYYSGESIFRGKIEKKIPYKGTIELNDTEYKFYFHGLGIEFKSEYKKIHYNNYAGKDGLGVYFTPNGIFEYYNYKPNKNIELEWRKLVEQNLIKQWMPEIPNSEVYYLV